MISCVISTSSMRVAYSTRCMSRRPSTPAMAISSLAVRSMPCRMGFSSPSASSSASVPATAPAVFSSHVAMSVLRGAS